MPSLTDVVPAAKTAIGNVNEKASTGLKGAFMYALAGVLLILIVCVILGLIFWPMLLWFYFGQPLSVAVAIQIVWFVAAT